MIPILCLIFIVGCHSQEDFYSRARNFSIEIINQTGLDDVAIAPFSVWSLMAGATLWTFGDYRLKISNSLILPTNKTKFLENYWKLRTIVNQPSERVEIADGMFVFIDKDFDIYPEFKKTMEKYFDAYVETFNFKDRNNIVSLADRYIEEKQEIINVFHVEDFVNASMIMCNAIKFSGYWKHPFDITRTIIKKFYIGDKYDPYYVRTMYQKMKIPYSNMDSMDANIMELALGEHGKVSLLLIFPHENKTLREVYNNFDKVSLLDIFEKLENDVKESGLKEIDLELPRVRVQTNIVLNKQLSDIGLNEVFESDDNKFSGITGEEIYIASVDHKAQFTIMETGVYVDTSTPGHFDYPIGTPKLEAEKPFIYFIVEKSTKTILFGGLYSKARFT